MVPIVNVNQVKHFAGLSLGLLVYWFKNLIWYSWKFEISLAWFIWKTQEKRLVILPKFLLVFVSRACHFSVILLFVPFLSLLFFTSPVAHPTPPVHRHAFLPLFFVVVVFITYLTLIRCILLLLLLLVKRLQLKIVCVLAAGLAENLIHMVFHQPFVIQHVST